MRAFIYTMDAILACFIIYFIYRGWLFLTAKKRYGCDVLLSGGGYFANHNRLFHILLSIYFVASITFSILYFTDVIQLESRGIFIMFGAIVCIALLNGTAGLYAQLGTNGLYIVNQFYDWREVEALEIIDSHYPEIKILKVTVPGFNKPITGNLSTKNLEMVNAIANNHQLIK